jgi:hypothetical protein
MLGMFEMLIWLYDGGKGKLTVPMLANAVIKGWITETQKKEIMVTKN